MAVAYSGGRDSLALLHATCRAARLLGLQVLALHVHHGLQPEADDWQRQARRLAARWRRRGWPLTLQTCKLSGQPAPGDSVEAWARRGRHEALARMAREAGASLLLLAQHRRDQAETVLLQLLRGGGPAGLAAMPVQGDRAGLVLARPWLNQPRQAIDAYVQRHRLQPVEDPSNLDPRWARNRMRLQVWPALAGAFADAETTLALAARRAAEAQAALAELAAIDLAHCVDAPAAGPGAPGAEAPDPDAPAPPSPRPDGPGALVLARWRSLSPARRANTLRAWWRAGTGRGLPEALLQRLLAEWPTAGTASWPPAGGWQAACHRGRLLLRAAPQAVPSPGPGAPRSPWPQTTTLDLSRDGLWPLPAWAGAWQVTACAQGGVARALLGAVVCRPRQGGERFQRAAATPARSLKKQFQALGVAEDGRTGPLLWSGDRLLFVPGLGLDARAVAAVGEPQCRLLWRPDVAG